jgi:hypothetical protein
MPKQELRFSQFATRAIPSRSRARHKHSVTRRRRAAYPGDLGMPVEVIQIIINQMIARHWPVRRTGAAPDLGRAEIPRFFQCGALVAI